MQHLPLLQRRARGAAGRAGDGGLPRVLAPGAGVHGLWCWVGGQAWGVHRAHCSLPPNLKNIQCCSTAELLPAGRLVWVSSPSSRHSVLTAVIMCPYDRAPTPLTPSLALQLVDNRNCVLCMECLKACPHRWGASAACSSLLSPKCGHGVASRRSAPPPAPLPPLILCASSVCILYSSATCPAPPW